MVTIGINVKNDKARAYADLIIDGLKRLETRRTNSLKPYIGRRVAIVRTGQGKALAIGDCVIGSPIIADRRLFDKLRDSHMVPPGSKFDIEDSGVKYLYPIISPVRYEKPKHVKHGIIARKIILD